MRKLVALAALAASTSLAFAGGPSKLVVHEWGTFTSISGEKGVALEYRPLVGVSDLPSFVYTAFEPRGRRNHIEGKGVINARVRMETPVIYFYSDEQRKVSVKVDFPKGKITEFYPRAVSVSGGSLDFGTVLVKPSTTGPLPVEISRNHYFRAREVDADTIRVCGLEGNEYEKFLFYRGVGDFDLPLTATLSHDDDAQRVHLMGIPGEAIVFENRGGRRSFNVVEGGCKGAGSAKRPLAGEKGTIEEALLRLLVAKGLYEKEARAMIATWEDSWFEEGLRVFYVLPRHATDEVLPLTISPKPTELVRVLVGRAEVITPEREAAVLEAVRKLGADRFEEREAAQKALAREGRFARPILQTALAKSRDPEITARIRDLLADK